MSTTTPNLGLTVPVMGDQISNTIPALGTNFQTLDNQVGTNTNQIGILSGNQNFVYPEQSTLYATDVAQGINDMANYALSNNLILRFKRGKEYVINQYINIPAGLTVDLNGAKITRNYDKTQYPTIRLAGNNEIYGGEINGNQANIPDAAVNFINYTDLWTMGDNVKIHDMYIHDSCGECIKVASNNVQIYNCTFGRALDHQIYMKPTTIGTQSYSNCHIWNNQCIDNVTTRELLKVADGFDNVLIEGNYFEATAGWFFTADNTSGGGSNGTIRVRNNKGTCKYFSSIGNNGSGGLQTSYLIFEKNYVTIITKIFKMAVSSTSSARYGFYVDKLKFIENSFICLNTDLTNLIYPIELDALSANLIEFERNFIDYSVITTSPILIKLWGIVGVLRLKDNTFITPKTSYDKFNNIFMQPENPPSGAVDGTNCKTIEFNGNTYLNEVSPLINDGSNSSTVSALLWDMVFANNKFIQSSGIVRGVNTNASNNSSLTKKVIIGKNYNKGGKIESTGVYNNSVVTSDEYPVGVNVAVSASAATLAVTGLTQPDNSYSVSVSPAWNTTYWITGKGTSGFTINFGTAPASASTLDWGIRR